MATSSQVKRIGAEYNTSILYINPEIRVDTRQGWLDDIESMGYTVVFEKPIGKHMAIYKKGPDSWGTNIIFVKANPIKMPNLTEEDLLL